ncbi:MAG: glutathione S-transferase family protein [Xenococcaceae cyanobacterium]
MTELTLIIGNKNYSSWSLRPWIAMKQFGLDFDEIRISLYNLETSTQIKKYSPAGKVPILIHNNVTIWDSLSILEYLAEEFSELNWWPKDKIARATARSISAEMHSGFLPLRHNMPMNCRAKFPGIDIKPEVKKDIDRITNIWQECREKYRSQGDLLFGKFSIADAMYAPVVLRFVSYGVPLNSICQQYLDSILELPALQEWIAAGKSETETIPEFEF